MIFKKNIAILREADRELANALLNEKGRGDLKMMYAKTGVPSLQVRDISLHSLYDPVKEAKAWVHYYAREIMEQGPLYVFGFGLGYHVLELCKVTHRHITVFVPGCSLLRKALETLDLTAILSRVRIITDGRVPSDEENSTLLLHKPSVNLDRNYFDLIKKGLKSREGVREGVTRDRVQDVIQNGLRILVVSPLYGGSLPIARYCSSALIKMGHRVQLMDNSRFHDALFFAKDIAANRQQYNRLMNHLSAFISEAVIGISESFKPDLVLALAQAPLTPECLHIIREQKVTTAYWFVEDFRFMGYWEKIAPSYDHFFTIQKDMFFAELERAGIRNYHYLPVAASPDVHHPVRLSEDERRYYGSDVSFVGAGYYNRRHFLEGLLDFDFKIWGTDWDMHSALAACIQRGGERIGSEEIVNIFNATGININLHSSTYHKGINPFGDFVNPRTFEIIASGGFQLVDRRPPLEELFEAGKELVVFTDLNDLRSKIRYYLDNPEERDRIIERGRQRILREHTYENRMQEMLEIIAGKGFENPLWPEEGEDVKRLIEESGEDSELGRYLSRFSGKGKITLSDITEAIAKEEGNISETEGLFMAMSEFIR